MTRNKIVVAICAIAFISLSLAFTVYCSKSGWAVKIDDHAISIDEFNNFYYTQNKMVLNLDKVDLDKLSQDPALENHPTINKKRFMDFIVSRVLLYDKAKNDDKIDQDKLKAIIDLSVMNAAATYYLTEKFKDEIAVTDAEANMFYNENRDLFKGVPIDDQIVKRIKQQIFMQKLEKKSNDYIMELIAEAQVNREGFNKYLRESSKDTDKVKTTDPNTEAKTPGAQDVPAKESDKAASPQNQ
ncbi:MAG: hypothetical protein JXA20_14620 [Spirochaetes bacterium]|nr:hypothetical protein [Spirochaetota bacterium]